MPVCTIRWPWEGQAVPCAICPSQQTSEGPSLGPSLPPAPWPVTWSPPEPGTRRHMGTGQPEGSHTPHTPHAHTHTTHLSPHMHSLSHLHC